MIEWRDGDPNFHEHDIAVGKYSDSGDFSSTTPSGVDWSSRCGARLSGSTWQDGSLWFSWMPAGSVSVGERRRLA